MTEGREGMAHSPPACPALPMPMTVHSLSSDCPLKPLSGHWPMQMEGWNMEREERSGRLHTAFLPGAI